MRTAESPPRGLAPGLAWPWLLICLLAWALYLGWEGWRQQQAVEALVRDAFEAVLDDLQGSLNQHQVWRLDAARRDSTRALLERQRSETPAIRRISVLTPQGLITDDTDPSQIGAQAPAHWLNETWRSGSEVWLPEPGLRGLERQLQDATGQTRAIVVVLARLRAGADLIERSRTAMTPRALGALGLALLASAWLGRRQARRLAQAWQPWRHELAQALHQALARLDQEEAALDQRAGLMPAVKAPSPVPQAGMAPPHEAPGLWGALRGAWVLAALVTLCAAWMGQVLQAESARTLAGLQRSLGQQFEIDLQHRLEALPMQGGDRQQDKRARLIEGFQSAHPEIMDRAWVLRGSDWRLEFQLHPKALLVSGHTLAHGLALLAVFAVTLLAAAGTGHWQWTQGFSRPQARLRSWPEPLRAAGGDQPAAQPAMPRWAHAAQAAAQAWGAGHDRVRQRRQMLDWKRARLDAAPDWAEATQGSTAPQAGGPA